MVEASRKCLLSSCILYSSPWSGKLFSFTAYSLFCMHVSNRKKKTHIQTSSKQHPSLVWFSCLNSFESKCLSVFLLQAAYITMPTFVHPSNKAASLFRPVGVLACRWMPAHFVWFHSLLRSPASYPCFSLYHTRTSTYVHHLRNISPPLPAFLLQSMRVNRGWTLGQEP